MGETRVRILNLGNSRRAQVLVLSGDRAGTVAWLSIRTAFMENLIGPLPDGQFWNMPLSVIAGTLSPYQLYDIGAVYDVLHSSQLFLSESLGASVVASLPKGKKVKILNV